MKHEIFIPEVGVIGSYELSPMPGCSVVGISHGLTIEPSHRGKGYGRSAMEDRIRQAVASGFQVLVCTVREGNEPEERILQKFQFKVVSHFDNPRSGNRVRLWIKNITDPYDCGFYAPGGCR